VALKFETREGAKRRLLEVWAPTIEAAGAIDVTLPVSREGYWETHRNYELEDELHAKCGDQWIIVEWCPYNGIYCAYLEVASKKDLRIARRNIGAAGARDPMLNTKMMFGHIDKELAKRPDDWPETKYYAAGCTRYEEDAA
jgi:hypothetical protein